MRCGVRQIIRTAAALLLATSPLSAQPRLSVSPEIRNVGDVLFQQPKRVNFELRNSGTEPLQLKEVRSSCGCTEALWPREPIAPGATANLEVVFDAQLLGSFQKEVEVFTNASDEPTYLTLQGRVVVTESETNYEDFPIDLGNVRLSTNKVDFGDVNRGDHAEAELHILNPGRDNYRPQLMHLPPYLSARYLPEQLTGGRAGRIILTLDSKQLKTFGLRETTVYLARKTGDRVSPENEIHISTVLLPSFAHYKESDWKTAPKMELSADSLDFSILATKKKATQVILITNKGQKPLTISSLQVTGRALQVKLSNRNVAPGKTVKLKVKAEADVWKKEKTTPQLMLITNDPKKPKTIIKAKNK